MFEKPDLSDQAKASFERVAKACRWTIVGAVVLLAVALFVPPVLLHLLHNAESLKLGAGGAELPLTGKQLRKADEQASKGPRG